MKLHIQTMSIILYVSLLILLTSTFIQGHENFDTNTADSLSSSSSSSKLENKLTDHNNSIRIGKLYWS